MIRLLGIYLLAVGMLLPTGAHALGIIQIAGAIGGALGFAGITALLVGGLIIIGVAMLAKKMFGKKQKGPEDPGQLVNKNANDAPIPVIYGTRRIGATRIFMRTAGATGGSGTEYLHIVYAICEGPIEKFDKIFFNDVLVYTDAGGVKTDAENPDPDGDPIDYTGLIEVNLYDGSQTTVSTELNARFGSEWGTDKVGNGIAYAYIRFKYNRDVFSGVPTVIFEIEGRKIRDVDNLSNPVAFSRNPANCVYDYLTHPIYGRNFPASELDLTSFQDAKDYYDVAHTYLNATDHRTTARNIFNGFIDTSQNTYDNTQAMMTTCNSALTYTGGKYHLIPFKLRNSEHTITDSEIIGDITLAMGNKTERFNTIRVSFADEDEEYQNSSIIIQNSTFKTEDNGLELKSEITLDLATNRDRAKLIAYEQLLQSRYSHVIELTGPHTLQVIEPMDIVTLDYSQFPDDVPTVYRCVRSVLTQEGEIKLTLQEYNSAVYTQQDPDNL